MRRLAKQWMLVSALVVLLWGCSGGGGSSVEAPSGTREPTQSDPPSSTDTPVMGSGLIPPATYNPPSGAHEPTQSNPPLPADTPLPPIPPPLETNANLTAASVNAFTGTDHSVHYVSRWFISEDSALTPTPGAPRCYRRSVGGQAGGECYYPVDNLRIAHHPDDLTFSNIQHTGTLPNAIPQFTADVAFTPTATDAMDQDADVVFPRTDADYTFFGGWLSYGVFGVLSTDQGEADQRVVGWIGLDVGIDRVNSNPRPSAAQLAAGSGEATWTGAMVGKTNSSVLVTGAMSLTYHFNAIITGSGSHNDDEVSVSFHSVTGNRAIQPFNNLIVRDAAFGGSRGTNAHMEGGFIGNRGSEEVMGNFTSNAITGAFGGRRQP